MEVIVAAALVFVNSLTGWQIPEQTPKILIDEQRVFLNSGRDAAYQGEGVILVREVTASLSPELVHEIVHFFQEKQNRLHKNNTSREECLLESEAEVIENEFRKNLGLELASFYSQLCLKALEAVKVPE